MRSLAIKIWTVVVLFLASAPIFSVADPGVGNPQVVLAELGFDSTNNQYLSRVYKINYGTTVVFKSVTGDKSYRLGNLLGSGDTTFIYELLDHPDKVIRIPSEHLWSWRMRYWKRSWLNATIKGGRALEKAKIPTVKIHDYRYDQYVVVDKVDGFTLEEYLLKSNEYSNAEKNKIENALVEFALKTTEYSKIDDFRPDQIMYDKKRGWLLTDWTWGVHKYKNQYQTVFDTTSEIFFEDSRPAKDNRVYADDLIERVVREIRLKRNIVMPSGCSYLFRGNL